MLKNGKPREVICVKQRTLTSKSCDHKSVRNGREANRKMDSIIQNMRYLCAMN